MTRVPPEIERRLEDERHVAHLATAVEDDPHVAPLWYRYEDGVFEVATTGRKLENIRRNSRVGISVQSSTNGMPHWMVAIQGTASVVDDPDVSDAGRARIHGKYGIDEDAFPENVLVRIEVGSVEYEIFRGR